MFLLRGSVLQTRTDKIQRILGGLRIKIQCIGLKFVKSTTKSKALISLKKYIFSISTLFFRLLWVKKYSKYVYYLELFFLIEKLSTKR